VIGREYTDEDWVFLRVTLQCENLIAFRIGLSQLNDVGFR
jgi:hypothetical protein